MVEQLPGCVVWRICKLCRLYGLYGKWNYVEAELHTNRSLMEVFFRWWGRCLNVLACWHCLLFLLPPNNKCFNQTCPGDKPEKQGVVRNQHIVPRWSVGSETTKKKKSARPPLLKPTFSAKTPQPNLISLDVCGQRKTNFSHAAYFSPSVARTLRNSSPSSTTCRWALLKSLRSRPAHNKYDNDNTSQHPSSSQAKTYEGKRGNHPGERDVESGTNLEYPFGFQHVVVSFSFSVNFLVILGFSITIYIRVQHYFSFFLGLASLHNNFCDIRGHHGKELLWTHLERPCIVSTASAVMEKWKERPCIALSLFF